MKSACSKTPLKEPLELLLWDLTPLVPLSPSEQEADLTGPLCRHSRLDSHPLLLPVHIIQVGEATQLRNLLHVYSVLLHRKQDVYFIHEILQIPP